MNDSLLETKVTRSVAALLCALVVSLLVVSLPAAAQTAPEAPEADDTATQDGASDEAERNARRGAARRTAVEQAQEREALKKEVLEDVDRALERAKEDIRREVSFVEAETDARSYDARELQELKRTVNLLQLHGYFRARGDMFNKADLNRGADPTGATLFPDPAGTSYLGMGNMRLRLNPILRVSDDIAVYSQIDVLDNVIAGGNPLVDPFFFQDSRAEILGARVGYDVLKVKRVWAEVETPIGQVAFGRKGFHWGEGLVYNDGNCFDCDYGTTFDRVQLAVGPVLGGHLFTVAADAITNGFTSAAVPALAEFNNAFGPQGRPVDVQQLDDGYRFSLAVTRIAPADQMRRRLESGDWVLNYGVLGAYRMQHSLSPSLVSGGTNTALAKIGANFGEGDVFVEFARRKLRLAFEGAVFGGKIDNRVGLLDADGAGPNPPQPAVFPGQSLNFLQFAALLRAQHAFLKQDSLLVGLDLGVASGDEAPGMGVRSGRPGSGPEGNTQRGDLDGPQFSCTEAGGCADDSVNNFVVNPDFRVDQILWRNLFTSLTDAFWTRAEVRFKPGGRASGGAQETGFEFGGALVYSQALHAASTPSGSSKPLGLEADVAVTYTSQDGFFAGVVAGFLFPLSGMNNTALGLDAEFSQVYRGMLGVTF